MLNKLTKKSGIVTLVAVLMVIATMIFFPGVLEKKEVEEILMVVKHKQL